MGIGRRDRRDGGRGGALSLELALAKAEITCELKMCADLLSGEEIGRVAIKLRNESSPCTGIVGVLLAGSEISR